MCLLRIDPDQRPFHLNVTQTKRAPNSLQLKLSLDAQIFTVLTSSYLRLHLFAAWQCPWGMCVKPSNIPMQHGVEVPKLKKPNASDSKTCPFVSPQNEELWADKVRWHAGDMIWLNWHWLDHNFTHKWRMLISISMTQRCVIKYFA